MIPAPHKTPRLNFLLSWDIPKDAPSPFPLSTCLSFPPLFAPLFSFRRLENYLPKVDMCVVMLTAILHWPDSRYALINNKYLKFLRWRRKFSSDPPLSHSLFLGVHSRLSSFFSIHTLRWHFIYPSRMLKTQIYLSQRQKSAINTLHKHLIVSCKKLVMNKWLAGSAMSGFFFIIISKSTFHAILGIFN